MTGLNELLCKLKIIPYTSQRDILNTAISDNEKCFVTMGRRRGKTTLSAILSLYYLSLNQNVTFYSPFPDISRDTLNYVNELSNDSFKLWTNRRTFELTNNTNGIRFVRPNMKTYPQIDILIMDEFSMVYNLMKDKKLLLSQIQNAKKTIAFMTNNYHPIEKTPYEILNETFPNAIKLEYE